MGKVKLLDCTLRDGGYINDWNFGKHTIEQILLKLGKTGIEMIEVGFVKGDSYDQNRTLFPDTDAFSKVILEKSKDITYVGMFDMSAPVSLDRIRKINEESIDGIRVIFKRDKIDEAYAVCQYIKEKGYKLFVNFVNTDCYSDSEFINGIEKYNCLDPDGMTIVDTFGMIKRKTFTRLAAIADHNMAEGISLCYHAHNNLQQAFGNAEALVDMNLSRDVCIDACVFGMGRGAGNLNLELFSEYMNENYGTSYQITPMLEIMDEYLSDFYKNKFWGYSLPFYLSATAGCHPNYAVYIAEKYTLTEKAFSEYLSTISEQDKLIFSQQKAEEYYNSFLDHYIDDKKTIQELSDVFKGKNVLLIGPGKTLSEKWNSIAIRLKDEKYITLSVNFDDNTFSPDFVFVSNMRRYRQLPNPDSERIIATSNISDLSDKNYVINLSSYTLSEDTIHDNAGVMALKFLICLGVSKIYIAGLDGYSTSDRSNYYSVPYETDHSNNYEKMNHEITKEIIKMRKQVDIEFLTHSKYDNTLMGD